MLLFGMVGTSIQISIVLLVSLIIFGFLLYLVCAYIYNVAYDNNVRAEKFIAYAGYYSIASMIVLFIIYAVGFKNKIIEDIDISYYGLLALVGLIALFPPLIIYDMKQVKWIKALDSIEQKKYGISFKDRMPLVVVLSVLVIINMALFGLCVEKFIYVIQGMVE